MTGHLDAVTAGRIASRPVQGLTGSTVGMTLRMTRPSLRECGPSSAGRAINSPMHQQTSACAGHWPKPVVIQPAFRLPMEFGWQIASLMAKLTGSGAVLRPCSRGWCGSCRPRSPQLWRGGASRRLSSVEVNALSPLDIPQIGGTPVRRDWDVTRSHQR